MNVKPLFDWINERHAIYIRKELRDGVDAGELFVPWGADLEAADPDYLADTLSNDRLTHDPIFQQYRFCNVFRELDRQTCWIRFNIRRRWKDHPDLWLMLAIARTINWAPTLQMLIDSQYAWPGINDNWTPGDMTRALEYYASRGNKVYTGAYMIRAESDPKKEWYSWSKHRYISEIVIGRLWEDRAVWRAFLNAPQDAIDGGPSIQVTWDRFQLPRYIGWGPFMAYQAVIDMRWTKLLDHAPDIQTWSAVGPGSRRGLNRLAGRPLDFNLKQDDALGEMRMLHMNQGSYRAPWVPKIDLSDIQNALCETDKYLRVKNGEGKPRSLYIQGRGY